MSYNIIINIITCIYVLYNMDILYYAEIHKISKVEWIAYSLQCLVNESSI